MNTRTREFEYSAILQDSVSDVFARPAEWINPAWQHPDTLTNVVLHTPASFLCPEGGTLERINKFRFSLAHFCEAHAGQFETVEQALKAFRCQA